MFVGSYLQLLDINAAMGKILSGIIVLIGIMLFALPTSILTAEFMNEFNSDKK